jgi:hypothetical protein
MGWTDWDGERTPILGYTRHANPRGGEMWETPETPPAEEEQGGGEETGAPGEESGGEGGGEGGEEAV